MKEREGGKKEREKKKDSDSVLQKGKYESSSNCIRGSKSKWAVSAPST